MSSTMPSCEANLLYLQSPDPAALSLDADIARLAKAQGLRAEPVPVATPGFQLYDLGPLQVLVAGCAEPLDIGHFFEAARPSGALQSDGAILSWLTAHTFSLTVLVDDAADSALPEDGARQELKERLCWEITESLRVRTGAALVFWCDNDTLYAGDEFARTGPYHPGAMSLPPEAAVHRLDPQQMLAVKAMSYMQAQIVQGAHRVSVTADTARRVSRDLKHTLTSDPLGFARHLSRRVAGVFTSKPI